MGETVMAEVNGTMMVISTSYDGGERTWGGFVSTEGYIVSIVRQACPLDVLRYLMGFTA